MNPESEIPYGYCQCGCGGKAPIAKQGRNARGFKKGEPQKFIKGHHPRGENHPCWKGGIKPGIYLRVFVPTDSPGTCYVLEHRLIAEKALGKPLPPGVVVHHYTPEQLVICQDAAYHSLLHKRQRAYEACGHANWRGCHFCKQYDDTKNMTKNHKGFHHNECRNAYMRAYNQRRKTKQ